MWIWAGANIAPVNWALGALGIILKLGLMETIAVIVLGNIVGCAIFATFTVMGHKTGVNQMVLSRSAFGVRGAYLPSILMFVMTLGWIGVNTYFPVKVSIGILGQFGVPDTWLIEIVIITLVMAAQVLIGVYGFYAIRTFEKYTVPPTIAKTAPSSSRLTRAPCAPLGTFSSIDLVAARCMAGSSVVQTSIGSLVSGSSTSSCGSAQSVK